MRYIKDNFVLFLSLVVTTLCIGFVAGLLVGESNQTIPTCNNGGTQIICVRNK